MQVDPEEVKSPVEGRPHRVLKFTGFRSSKTCLGAAFSALEIISGIKVKLSFENIDQEVRNLTGIKEDTWISVEVAE